jgi:hypothetical protein
VIALLAVECFTNTKNNLLLIYFYFFGDFVTMQVMTRELATKMECNFCSPMKMPKKIYGSDFLKEISKGNLGRQRDEMRRK